MTNEQIIRDEANEFAFQKIEICENSFNGSRKLIDLVKEELLHFYDPEGKMIYLDQIIKNVVFYQTEHEKKCVDGKNCDIDKVYKKMLFYLEQEFNSLPKIVHKNKIESSHERVKVFISYSHKDKLYLDDLRRHFKPIEKYADIWDDTKIEPGQKWKEEIEKSMKASKIALLLISADFFNSDFINSKELPKLLEAAEKDGATILSVILKPCLFEEYPEINQYQAVNNPTMPISGMSETDRERVWVELVKQIRDIKQNKS